MIAEAARLLIAFAIPIACLTGCDDSCANTLVKSVKAPDGQHIAVLFQRDCGATTGFSTQISVVRSGDSVSGTGSAFIADDDHGATRDTAWHGPWVNIVWQSNDRLTIVYDARARVFKQDKRVGAVKLTYRPVDRPIEAAKPQIKVRNSSSTAR